MYDWKVFWLIIGLGLIGFSLRFTGIEIIIHTGHFMLGIGFGLGLLQLINNYRKRILEKQEW